MGDWGRQIRYAIFFWCGYLGLITLFITFGYSSYENFLYSKCFLFTLHLALGFLGMYVQSYSHLKLNGFV